MDNDGLTQYMRIAISVAERIAAGELREGEKISGRSKLSSEYEVSPETVRRAIQLLSDMRVVAVKEQSGVYVLSADNAKRYLRNFDEKKDVVAYIGMDKNTISISLSNGVYDIYQIDSKSGEMKKMKAGVTINGNYLLSSKGVYWLRKR